MSSNKDKRRAKKQKVRQENNRAKVLKIREKLRADAKAQKETDKMKRDIEKISFQGTTIRGKVSG
jgi:hypothetical protein